MKIKLKFSNKMSSNISVGRYIVCTFEDNSKVTFSLNTNILPQNAMLKQTIFILNSEVYEKIFQNLKEFEIKFLSELLKFENSLVTTTIFNGIVDNINTSHKLNYIPILNNIETLGLIRFEQKITVYRNSQLNEVIDVFETNFSFQVNDLNYMSLLQDLSNIVDAFKYKIYLRKDSTNEISDIKQNDNISLLRQMNENDSTETMTDLEKAPIKLVISKTSPLVGNFTTNLFTEETDDKFLSLVKISKPILKRNTVLDINNLNDNKYRKIDEKVEIEDHGNNLNFKKYQSNLNMLRYKMKPENLQILNQNNWNDLGELGELGDLGELGELGELDDLGDLGDNRSNI